MSRRVYHVMASNLTATYSAGRFEAESGHEARELARKDYARSNLGRTLKDAGAFRFWVCSGCEMCEPRDDDE